MTGMGLNGGRGARGAMLGHRIQRSRTFREDWAGGDVPDFVEKIDASGGECGDMDRLAEMASSIRVGGMLMEKGAARGEIQQGHDGQEGQGALAEH